MNYFYSLIFLSLSISMMGQKDSLYTFVGALTTGDQQVISYKLEFEVGENDSLFGTSTTDFYGKNITESSIRGVFSKKKISFKEFNNISTRSKAHDSSFCFVSVSELKVKKVMNKRMINGQFKGVFPNGKECAIGVIYLVNNIDKQIKKFEDKMSDFRDSTGQIILPDNLDSVTDILKPKSNDDLLVLKNGDKDSVLWNSDKILLEVWDGSKEDGDKIDVYFNDTLVKHHLVTKKKPIVIEIPFGMKLSTLKIVAINEGKVGINTVNILLSNDHDAKPYISKLRKGEEVEIHFRKL